LFVKVVAIVRRCSPVSRVMPIQSTSVSPSTTDVDEGGGINVIVSDTAKVIQLFVECAYQIKKMNSKCMRQIPNGNQYFNIGADNNC